MIGVDKTHGKGYVMFELRVFWPGDVAEGVVFAPGPFTEETINDILLLEDGSLLYAGWDNPGVWSEVSRLKYFDESARTIKAVHVRIHHPTGNVVPAILAGVEIEA